VSSVIEAEVVVIGAGMAGLGTAIEAARNGLSVLLVESNSGIGGVMVQCPGMPLGAAFPCGKSVGGLLNEFAGKLINMSPPAAEIRPCSLHEFGPEIVYDHEVAIAVLYQMLAQANVNLLLNTAAIEPELDKNHLVQLNCSNRNGSITINGKVFIDCSGDGDLTAKAGVPFQLGDDHGHMMGASMTFIMDSVNWEKAFRNNEDPYFTTYAAMGIAEGRLHEDLHKIYIMKGFHQNTAFFNSVVISNVNWNNQLETAIAANEARKRSLQLAQFVIDEIPGFEKARLACLGPGLGIRETRKFEGIYRLTAADLAGAVKFDDGVVACDNPVDDVFRGANEMTHDRIVTEGDYYTIPFRSMVPVHVDNLLFAGRNISADPVAFASVRGMSQCMIMGQACGIAAQQVVENKLPVQAINTAEVVRALTARGVYGLKV
jgi:hypothetical protein